MIIPFIILVIFPFFESFKRQEKSIQVLPESIAWVTCKGPIVTIKFKRRAESVGKLKKIKIFVSPRGREEFFERFNQVFSVFLPREYRLVLVEEKLRQGPDWQEIKEAYGREEERRKLAIRWENTLAFSKTAALVLGIIVIGYLYVGYSRISLDTKKREALASVENKIAALQIKLDAAREQPYPSVVVLKGGKKICCEILVEEQDSLRIVSARGPIDINRDDTVSVVHSARDHEIKRLESKIGGLEAKKKMIE